MGVGSEKGYSMKSSFTGIQFMKHIGRKLLLILAISFGMASQTLAYHYTITATEPSPVTEGGTLTFSVSINPAPSDGDIVEVGYTAGTETATSGDDFTPASGTLTFNSGSSGPLTFNVITDDDSIVEGNETVKVEFTVTPSNDGTVPSNPTCTADGPATPIYGTITDNDQYAVASFADVSVAEDVAGGNAILTVTLNQQVVTGQTVAFNVTATAGTAQGGGVDFSAPPGTLIFTGGEQTKTISVPIVNDSLVELAETFTVTITPTTGNVSAVPSPATVTINPDDDKYSVASFANINVSESVGNAVLTVNLNQPVVAGQTVAFNVTANPGTALSGGVDYTEPVGTLTFTGGQQSLTITVPINNDTLVEAAETFTVTITPTSGNVSTVSATATVTINIDDRYTITFNSPTLPEPTGATATMSFTSPTPSISPAIDAAHHGATINWSTTNVSASAGSDYVAASGTLTLTAGGVSGNVNVTINPDTLDETSETFRIIPASGGTLPVSLVQFAGNTGTITDNDNRIQPSWNLHGTMTLQSPAGTGVAITNGTAVIIPDGQEAVFTVQADYRIKQVTIDGTVSYLYGAGNTPPAYVIRSITDDKLHSYTFTSTTPQVVGPHTIVVVFDHQIEMTANGNGTVTHTTGTGQNVTNGGPVAVIADHGQSETFRFDAGSGACVADVRVDNTTSLGAFITGSTNYTGNTYTFSNVTDNHAIAATFGKATVTVLLGADDGATGTDDDLYIQTHSNGWRAYVTDSGYSTSGLTPFKTGTHAQSFSVPDDTSSVGGCNVRYVVIEFLTMDGWQPPNRIPLDLHNSFTNQQVTGLYDKDSHVLTIISPNGTVTRSPDGDAAIGAQRYLYSQGTDVALGAAANAGWYFSLWKGDIGAATATSSTITVTMDRDRTVEAVFIQPCQDNDKDSFTAAGDGSCAASAQIDCDDTNKLIYPGAAEICGDGIDQDCNGSDLACGPMDQDTDKDGYTPRQGDCNDANANIRPGAYDDPNTAANEDCYDDAKIKGSEITCVQASDVPANAAVKPAPPLITYLIDDSGSMDWEFMTSEDNGRFSNRGYVFSYSETQKTYNNDSDYRVLTDAQRRLWRSQWQGYNRLYFNPNSAYVPWPKWEMVSGVTVRANEKTYNPTATGAVFPGTAYPAGYTHADMDYPRLNSHDVSGTISAMYHPGGSGTIHDLALNAEYFSVRGGQQVMVTRDGSSTGNSTYADAIGLSTRADIQTTATKGFPVASFSTTVIPYRPEIIFDNSDSSTYSELGTWYNTSNNPIYAWNGNGRFADAVNRSAYWSLNLTAGQAGGYYVYAWVNEEATRDTNALYTIYYYNTSGVLTSTTYRRSQRPDNGVANTPRYGARWIRLNSTPINFVAQSASAIISVPNAHYYTKDNNGNTYLVTMPGSGYTVGNYSLKYYLFNDVNNDNIVDNGELIEKAGADIPTEVIPKRKDALGNDITNPAQLAYMVRQDFANWFTFYRKRILTTKAAIGLSVEGMKGVELGLHTINRSASKPLALMETADGAAKISYLSTVYNLRASGSTPLRRGLYEVGRYYQKGNNTGEATGLTTTSGLGTAKGPTCTSSDTSVFWDAHQDIDTDTCDDSGGECQRAYVIAMTDGYYNENFTTLDNIDANSAYNTSSIFRDGIGSTLADVAMYFYATDLDPDLGDNVPTKGFDNNPKQHLVTYTVAFGVNGQYNSNLFPDCLPSCKTPGSEGCPKLDDLSSLTWSAYSSGTGMVDGVFKRVCPTWWNDDPNGAESIRRIDDLYHAAVNSRGAFLNAADPQELVAAMQTIKDLIEDQTGTASSVSINANKVEEDTLLFQTTYDSSDWSGDMLAKCLDSVGLVSSCSRVSCELSCSTAYTACEAACPEGDAACLTACKTSRTTCTSSCTGETCAQAQASCLAACTDSSCQVACSNANRTCLLNPPEVKWSATKKLSTVTATTRKIVTSTEAGTGIAFRYDALTPLMKTQLQGDTHILNYLRGDATYERKNDSTNFRNFRNRSGKLGDFINSEPFHYANPTLGIDWVIAGSNDGMLHVFDGNTGDEVFAYVPQEVFKNLYLLPKETYNDNHKFFVDGYVTVQNLGNKVVLIGSLGKGGKGLFALDLTAAHTHQGDIEANADKIVLWEYTPSAFSSDAVIRDNLGYSFFRPQIVKSNDTSANWVLVFGNGYESVNMRAALFAVGLDQDGAIQWSRVIDTGLGNSTNCNGLSTPAMIFPQGDGKNDFAYAGDLLGNMWKFDLNDVQKDNWSIYFENTSGVKQPLFQARSSAGYRQPITMQPVIISACPLDTKGYMVLFGTGRMLDPSDDFLDQSVQTVYGIFDWSAAWGALSPLAVNPKHTFLGAFQPDNTSLVASCTSSCATIRGDVSSSGSCIYQCAGDAECEAECQLDYSSCVTNCGAVRNLSNVANIIGSTDSTYVTLLRQTQIWAGGINYNSDGSVKETVYGAANMDVYDQIARVMSDNMVDWYLPVEHAEFSSNPNKTMKHAGWYFDLPANGERIVRDMTVANGKLIFTSTIPSNSPCKSGGTSYHWAVDACTGGRLGSAFFDLNSDERIDGYDYINIGSEAKPIWVAVSAIGVRGISPAVTVVDVVKNAYERLYSPDQDELATMLGNVHGTPITYWRDLDWKP